MDCGGKIKRWIRTRAMKAYICVTLLLTLLLTSCSGNNWNNPYPDTNSEDNTYYSVFTERPKALDPAQSYASNEYAFIGQIYEPPLQYHYLNRPYQLIPLSATEVPVATYYGRDGRRLPADAALVDIAQSEYVIHIKPHIMYQPHPALAKKINGVMYYNDIAVSEMANINDLGDFTKVGTRELVADDFVYQVKRIAGPAVESPILGLMSNYILGLDDLHRQLLAETKKNPNKFLDLHQFNLAGVKTIDRYTYSITIKGKYPQFIYWLTMPFFAPMPWEADYFYSLPGMSKKNIDLDWYPIGTGPYMLTENNPNRKMVLERNPNFHGERYPTTGTIQDQQNGYLAAAGQMMPFIDKAVFSLEKEDMPRWNKFLQGYYDQSGISADTFDKVVRMAANGDPYLSSDFVKKKIRLETSVSPSVFYYGFNMLDDMVGGNTERARKLRLAIAIAIDIEEYINIFLNGRGIAAQSPLPSGIVGFQQGQSGINPYVYAWDKDQPKRKSIEEARQLLREAGYPNGHDSKTHKPLVISYDAAATGPDQQSQLAWLQKQFSQLGIELNIRATQYNRFQEKVRTGKVQFFMWGWHADYPDPENFLFLLYGPNGRVHSGGENTVNYQNAAYDRLFEQMKNTPNGPARDAVIAQMLELIRHDAPWVFGFFPKSYSLAHHWVAPQKPQDIANNTLKYVRIDPVERKHDREQWNHPTIWPLVILLLGLITVVLPVAISYRRKEHDPPQYPDSP
jgi:oligopeptide transport system substrate-binding protein